METLRRFIAFPDHYIKCKVATQMGERIPVLSSLASVAVFSAIFFLLFIPWPCAFRTVFSGSFRFAKRELKRALQHWKESLIFYRCHEDNPHEGWK